MSRTCEEFYSEVQSLACQEDLHESIDSEILSHNSFNNYKQQFNQYMKQSKNISNSLQNDKKPKIYGKKNKNKKYKKIKKPNRLPALATIGIEDFEEEDTNYTNNTYNNEECVQSVVSSIENMSFQQPLISPRTKYISGNNYYFYFQLRLFFYIINIIYRMYSRWVETVSQLNSSEECY